MADERVGGPALGQDESVDLSGAEAEVGVGAVATRSPETVRTSIPVQMRHVSRSMPKRLAAAVSNAARSSLTTISSAPAAIAS